MARIYTRTGDRGETSLFDGTRTAKSDERVDLYGELDELNSHLGLCAELLLRDGRAVQVAADADEGIGEGSRLQLSLLASALLILQNDLFAMGAILADPPRCRELAGSDAKLPFDAELLEKMIDGMQDELPPLRSFVLPSGSVNAAALHVARTVCRRVERKAVGLARREPLPHGILAYLNRLSDYLFVAARWANHIQGQPDTTWPPAGESQEDQAP
jgi:cob(I)alamin adenosyltransferase